MKCIAIDDEPLALELMEDFCCKVVFLELVATCENAIEAMDVLKKEHVDVMFVDINMPQITGLDFIKSLINPPIIIFTTAYSEHAVTGYELDAVDYLVKPIPFNRFLKAANKAKEIYEARKSMYQSGNNIIVPSLSDTSDYIMIKVEYSTVKVNLNDILYVEGVRDYVKLKLTNNFFLTRSSMKNIEEKLPSTNFVRVHKSYLISLSKIEKIENNRIVYGQKRIPVGEQYKENFYNIINKKRL